MTINLSVGISSNDQRLYYDQQTFLKLVNDTHEKTRLSIFFGQHFCEVKRCETLILK